MLVITAHRELEVKLHWFLKWHQMEDSDQTFAPAASNPEEITTRIIQWLTDWVGPGFDTEISGKRNISFSCQESNYSSCENHNAVITQSLHRLPFLTFTFDFYLLSKSYDQLSLPPPLPPLGLLTTWRNDWFNLVRLNKSTQDYRWFIAIRRTPCNVICSVNFSVTKRLALHRAKLMSSNLSYEHIDVHYCRATPHNNSSKRTAYTDLFVFTNATWN